MSLLSMAAFDSFLGEIHGLEKFGRILGKLTILQVKLTGLSWFIMVYHGLSWFIMVYHGLSSFSAKSNGVSSFSPMILSQESRKCKKTRRIWCCQRTANGK
jgi:ABC-type uncharacterized transport system fused permease/ATPase subunit